MTNPQFAAYSFGTTVPAANVTHCSVVAMEESSCQSIMLAKQFSVCQRVRS
ncbi:hypothetical protein ACNKHT_18070 [Shigella flexneri]